MAKFHFDVGAEFETLTKDEMADLFRQVEDRQRAGLSGIKYMRLPVLQGVPVSGVLNIGGDINANQIAGSFAGSPAWSGKPVGPTQGNAWEIKRLAVSGLTAGVTADIVNLIRPGSGPDAVWQFNGNNFAYTFGRAEIIVLPGETLQLVSVGTFAATGNIRLSGELIQSPAEMLGKLVT